MESLTVKYPQFDSGILLVVNLSASWLFLVETSKDVNPQASLEDSSQSYSQFSETFFPFSFLFFSFLPCQGWSLRHRVC